MSTATQEQPGTGKAGQTDPHPGKAEEETQQENPGRDMPDNNGEPPSVRRTDDPEGSEPPVEDY